MTDRARLIQAMHDLNENKDGVSAEEIADVVLGAGFRWMPPTHAEILTINIRLRDALRNLVFQARTSGGVAGTDLQLCRACEAAEMILATHHI